MTNEQLRELADYFETWKRHDGKGMTGRAFKGLIENMIAETKENTQLAQELEDAKAEINRLRGELENNLNLEAGEKETIIEIRKLFPAETSAMLDEQIADRYSEYCDSTHGARWTDTDLNKFGAWLFPGGGKRNSCEEKQYDNLRLRFHNNKESQRIIYFTETESGELDIKIEGYSGITEAAKEFIEALNNLWTQGQRKGGRQMTNEQLDGNTEKKYKIITSGGPINIDMPHGWSIQLVPSEVQRDSDPYSQYQLHEAIEKIKALKDENVALRIERDDLRKEVDRLRFNAVTNETRIDVLERGSVALRKERDRLQGEVEMLKRHVDSLLIKISNSERLNDAIRNREIHLRPSPPHAD